jgi:hypothetical protein
MYLAVRLLGKLFCSGGRRCEPTDSPQAVSIRIEKSGVYVKTRARQLCAILGHRRKLPS